MSSLNLFGKEWLNIVFENRNKLYGAYKLRQESTKTTFMALAIGIGTLSLIFGSSYLYASKGVVTGRIIEIPSDPIVPDIIDPIEDKPEAKPIVEKDADKTVEKAIEKSTVKDVMKNIKLIDMTAAKDTDVKDDKLAAQGDFDDNTNSSHNNTDANKDGTLNKDGKESGDENKGTGTKSGDGDSTDGSTTLKGNEIVRLVQKKASPNEGYEKFFESFIRKFSAKDVSGNSGEIVVKLKFVVEKDGSFTDIKILEDQFGLGNEAIRVLKSMPKWKAAQHNGKTVRSMFTLPIKVRINN